MIRTQVAETASAAADAGLADLSGWDALRFASFVDIAWFHTTGLHLLLGIGLPIFLVVSLALSARHEPPEGTRRFILRRLDRLGRPWVVWSLAFTLLDTVSALRHGQSALSWWTRTTWLTGPALHLWFLPTLLVLGIVVHLVDQATQRVPPIPFVGACLVVSAVGFWIADVPSGVEGPVAAYAFSLPAVPLALAVGRTLARSHDPRTLRRRLLAILAGTMLLALPELLLQARHETDVQLRYLLAIGAMAIVLYLPIGHHGRRLRALLLGCYTLHPLVRFQIAGRLATRFQLARWMEASIVVILTIALVSALRRSALVRRSRLL